MHTGLESSGELLRSNPKPDTWLKFARGFGALYQKHITQADQGCDFDFLEGTAPTAEPEIH